MEFRTENILRRILLILFFYTIIAQCFAQSLNFTGDKYEQFFPSGEPQVLRYKTNGIPTGVWEDFLSPGVLHGVINYETGIAESYGNGTLLLRIGFCNIAMYRGGGWYERWNEKGIKIEEGYYHYPPQFFNPPWISITLRDTKSEIINRYDVYGQIIGEKKDFPTRIFDCSEKSSAPEKANESDLVEIFSCHYYKDENVPYNGIKIFYYPSGKKSAERPVVNGYVSSGVEYFETGVRTSEVLQTDSGEVHVTYYPTGNPKFRYYSSGDLYEEFYENGQLRYQSTINSRVVYRQWFEDGQVMLDGQLQNGKSNGTWTWYALDGKTRYKSMEDRWHQGLQDGLQKHWYPDGSQFQVVPFHNGLYDGDLITYSPDGSLLSLQSFQDGKRQGESYRTDESETHNVSRFYENDSLVRAEIRSKTGEVLFVISYSGDDPTITESKAAGWFVVCGKVTQVIPHCGGVWGESIWLPYSGMRFYIKQGQDNNASNGPVQTITADEDGRFITALPVGTFCFLEHRKTQPLDPKLWTRPQSENHGGATEECYRSWWQRCEMSFEFSLESLHQTGLEFTYSSRCFVGDDPCLQYYGPWPP